MIKKRSENEPSEALRNWGWRFHHLGIPTQIVRKNEKYLPELKFHVSGFETSPFGIEWMRFDSDCELHPLIRQVPHLAFVVDDLVFELQNRSFNVISEPSEPSEGVRVAMIEHEGAPVELMEFCQV